jgi:hypothetical protein
MTEVCDSPSPCKTGDDCIVVTDANFCIDETDQIAKCDPDNLVQQRLVMELSKTGYVAPEALSKQCITKIVVRFVSASEIFIL